MLAALPKKKGNTVVDQGLEMPRMVALRKHGWRFCEDSIVGAKKNGDMFFRAIHEIYNDKYKPRQRQRRSFESIIKRVKLVTKQCLTFSSCVARIARMNSGGRNDEDQIKLATAIYNERDIRFTTDDCGPEFKLMTVWHVLKDHLKFMAAFEGEKKSTTPQASNEEGGSAVTADGYVEYDKNSEAISLSLTRPTGRHKEQDMLAEYAVARKKIKVAEEVVADQQRSNEIMQTHSKKTPLFQCPNSL